MPAGYESPRPLSPAQLRDLELVVGAAIVYAYKKIENAPPPEYLRTGAMLEARGYVERVGKTDLGRLFKGGAVRPTYKATVRGIVRFRAERSHRRHCLGCKLCVFKTKRRAA